MEDQIGKLLALLLGYVKDIEHSVNGAQIAFHTNRAELIDLLEEMKEDMQAAQKTLDMITGFAKQKRSDLRCETCQSTDIDLDWDDTGLARCNDCGSFGFEVNRVY